MIHNHEVRSSILRPATLKTKLTENQALAEKMQVLFSYMAVSETVMIWLWQGFEKGNIQRGHKADNRT